MLFDSEAEIRKQLEHKIEDSDKAAQNLNTALAKLHREKRSIEEEHERVGTELSKTKRLSNERQLEFDAMLGMLRQENASLREQKEALDQSMQQCRQRMASLESEQDAQPADSRHAIGGVELDRSLLSQAAKAVDLEASNRQLHKEAESLKASLQNNRVLEERILALEFRLGGHQELQDRYSKLEVQLEQARCQSRPPTIMDQARHALEQAMLQERLGDLQGQLSSASLAQTELKEEAARLRLAFQKADADLRSALDSLRESQARQQLQAEEVRNLHSQLASLESAR